MKNKNFVDHKSNFYPHPLPPISRLYQNPSRRNSKPKHVSVQFISTLRQKTRANSETFTKWKIKSINNFAIHSKFHLNNRVYIFRSIYKCFKLFHQTLRSLITPTSDTFKYSTTFMQCHLFFYTCILLQVWNILVYVIQPCS